MPAMDDTKIWSEFKNGNEAAFAQIYKIHAKLLVGYGMKLTKDADLVEDCIHDLFIELWERKTFLSNTDSVKLYLLKGLKRKIFRVLATSKKKSGNTQSLTEDINAQVVYSHEAVLISTQFTNEQQERLKQGIGKLSENQREIIYLRFYASLSYEEISQLMAINYQSVKNLMFRTIKSLRKEFTTSLISVYLLFSFIF
jgi:RNA polymerase sigma factor (sigma-70 family)